MLIATRSTCVYGGPVYACTMVESLSVVSIIIVHLKFYIIWDVDGRNVMKGM